MPVEIYPAGEKQLDDICYAYNRGMNDENNDYTTNINYNRVMRKIVTLTDPCFKTEVLLARSKENGKIAGILIGVYNEYRAYLNDLSVLPEFQNCGLASLFVKKFADGMRIAGVKEIILDTRKDTDEQKRGAAKTNQKMYTRLGFVDRIETFQTLIKSNAVFPSAPVRITPLSIAIGSSLLSFLLSFNGFARSLDLFRRRFLATIGVWSRIVGGKMSMKRSTFA